MYCSTIFFRKDNRDMSVCSPEYKQSNCVCVLLLLLLAGHQPIQSQIQPEYQHDQEVHRGSYRQAVHRAEPELCGRIQLCGIKTDSFNERNKEKPLSVNGKHVFYFGLWLASDGIGTLCLLDSHQKHPHHFLLFTSPVPRHVRLWKQKCCSYSSASGSYRLRRNRAREREHHKRPENNHAFFSHVAVVVCILF